MISTIDERAQGVADELGLSAEQREIVAVALTSVAYDMAAACDAWAPVWRDYYSRKIAPHQLATAVWAMGRKIRLFAHGKAVEIKPGEEIGNEQQ